MYVISFVLFYSVLSTTIQARCTRFHREIAIVDPSEGLQPARPGLRAYVAK